jgi:hypothetical protein
VARRRFDAEQLQVARAIEAELNRVRAGPLTRRAAYKAALVESNARNVRHGDRDSLGVFQQRPSQGWGTPEQVTDPHYAARQFVTRAVALEKKGFKGTSGQLAQAVQRSAFPERYDQRAAEATALQRAAAGGRGPTASLPGTPETGVTQVTDTGQVGVQGVPQGSEGMLALLEAQQRQQVQPPPSAGVPAPKFSAATVLPQGHVAQVPSSGPPQPPPSVADALAAIQTVGGDVGGTPTEEQGFTGITLPDAQGGQAGRTGSSPVSGKRPAGQLKELFWQGPGGINVKNGKPVPQGFVSGHNTHVHVASGPKQIVRLGRIAQKRFGLNVGEHPEFGGVDPVHTSGSHHYSRRAIDVSGDVAKMRAFARYIAGVYGVR